MIWAAIIVALFCYRDKFTVENILAYTPSNPILAALVMLALFALKSVSIVFYCKILYAADGIIFPLPVAILVNILGTAVMTTIPYLIGRRSGSAAVERITQKYPKAARLRDMQQQNDFTFVLLVRLIGLLPADIMSMYMGAINVDFKNYLLGGLVGMLVPCVTFAVMGMSITNPRSPLFISAVVIQIVFAACSIIYQKLKNKKTAK